MSKELGLTESKITLKQAKPVRLFEQAVEQIKKLIQSGHLKPGDKLPSESELSKLFSMSRSSVREALRSLESRGLIQVRPGAGASVLEDALIFSSVDDALQNLLPRRDKVLQLLQVRGALERQAAAQAAVEIDKEHLAGLEELLSQQDRLANDNANPQKIKEWARLDCEFHLAIAKACKNDIIFEILSVLIPSFYQDNQVVVLLEEGLLLVQEHYQILHALQINDADRAEREMGHHINRVISEVHELRKADS